MITLKSSVYLKETKKLRKKKKEKRNPPKEHAFVYLSTLIVHLRVSFYRNRTAVHLLFNLLFAFNRHHGYMLISTHR